MLSLLCDNAKQLPDSDADTVIKALCLVCAIMKSLYAQFVIVSMSQNYFTYNLN